MRLFLTTLFAFSILVCSGQNEAPDNDIVNNLKLSGTFPEGLLSKRAVAVHHYTFTDRELESIQKSFKQTGIDAVAYFETDLLLSGRDPGVAYANYFIKRGIEYLVFLHKDDGKYKIYITTFNKRETFIDPGQEAWHAEDVSLSELQKKIFRVAGNLKNQNLLINDYPEKDILISIFGGRRAEFFALDLKVDMLAVPKFGDETKDKELEEIFSSYPYKYKFVEPGITERELRRQGFLYVLYFVHARGSVVRKVLGYNTGSQESAYVSVTYPEDQPQMKSIPANTPVYKFYFKHIESGNIFLGTKYDADVTWQQALKNQLTGFITEVK